MPTVTTKEPKQRSNPQHAPMSSVLGPARPGRLKIGDVEVDDIYAFFVHSQRIIYGLPDQAVDKRLFLFVEKAMREAAEKGVVPTESTFQRYFSGELTDGIQPIELASQAMEMRIEGMFAFFTVLELLRIRTDGESSLLLKKGRKPDKADKLANGQLGPFVLTRVKDEAVVFCWKCKVVHSRDMVAIMEEHKCPSCGAKKPGKIEEIKDA